MGLGSIIDSVRFKIDGMKKYKIPIAKGILAGTAVALGGITLDSMVYNTSLYDIAMNSWNRSIGYDILGMLIGTYETLRNIGK